MSVVTLAAGAPAGPEASRLIDRTLVCRMPGEGFPDVTRFMAVSVFDQPPGVSVMNGPSYELRASIRTRASGRQQTGGAALHRDACTTTPRRVALSRVGLRRTQRRRVLFECDVPQTVLIRLRATFARPTGWVRDPETREIVHAKGTIVSGSLVVTTLGGKPVAHGSVDNRSNTASLFTSSSRCRPT